MAGLFFFFGGADGCSRACVRCLLHKQIIARAGQTNAVVTFTLTNLSTAPVIIRDVSLSCGCSVATMPAKPWTLKPGEFGAVTVTTDVRGKRGSLVKTAIVYASSGTRVLTYQLDIQEPSTPEERVRNQSLAKTDRQAVFRGEGAKCHAEPAKGKLGKELFTTACGICHEAEHRATMVPDLKALKQPTNREYWRTWIAHGKADTLMPGFGQKADGPLTEGQIESLVEFLMSPGTQPTVKR
jgi:mono/diheme cytochrome c family protein